MARDTLIFVQPNTGKSREAPVGFSWTVLFFGTWVPLLRGHWTWACLMFLIDAATFGFAAFVFPFIYNTIYIKSLVRGGFRAKGAKQGSLAELVASVGLDIPTLDGASSPA